MNANTAAAQEREPFRAILTPHRSLSPKGFFFLMTGFGIVSFVAGIVFWMIGAWPVMGFFGLDMLIVYIAFKLNYRSGRLYETVEVEPGETRVTRVHPSGPTEVFRFVSAWVRVELDEAIDGRTALRLRHHNRTLVFARFLNDDERREFASALSVALRQAGRPGMY